MGKIMMLNEMKDIICTLSKASYNYYALDNPIMTDKEYDTLYDKLLNLEKETGITLAGSPTQKVQGYVLDKFNKVEHSKPMLSANKTKDANEIKKFLRARDFYCSYKLDGLTLVTIFENGKFIKGITRGNGLIGEDVTEQCKFIKNLPMTIPYKDRLELRGECVISWDEFNRLNETLTEKYSHPRNLAAGTLRNLDLNIVKERNLSFVVFECVSDLDIDSKFETLIKLESFGFETVNRYIPKDNDIDSCIELMKPENSRYPVDGLIFEVDSNEISKSMGATSHHENCRMALKWADEEYETTLKDIEWSCGKSGQITPIAIFEPVEIDGTIVERASLHNISVMEELYDGQWLSGFTVSVYKANAIIPQLSYVKDNINFHSYNKILKPPSKCPICNSDTEIQQDNNSKILICTNPNCKGKLLGKLTHFVSKNAMNIDGLSEATLEKFINKGFVNSFVDIYRLRYYGGEIESLEGFGQQSTVNLLTNIEDSKITTLDRFINALSIPMVGKTIAKIIAKDCKYSIEEFLMRINGEYCWNCIDGVGSVVSDNINDFYRNNYNIVDELVSILTFKIPETKSSLTVDNNILKNKVIVITGSLNKFSNRNELQNLIENLGGKIGGSISKKTTMLINNDKNSNSSKNKKAKELGIKIITEEEFLREINYG